MREIIKECRKLAAKYGVKVYFKPLSGPISGCCDCENEIIKINSSCKLRQDILSVFFHELGHVICYRKGIWSKYHIDTGDREQMMKSALKAERWVDRFAEHELYKYDKRIRYLAAYDGDDKQLKAFLENYYSSKKSK